MSEQENVERPSFQTDDEVEKLSAADMSKFWIFLTIGFVTFGTIMFGLIIYGMTAAK
jgi:hypothetical protein